MYFFVYFSIYVWYMFGIFFEKMQARVGSRPTHQTHAKTHCRRCTQSPMRRASAESLSNTGGAMYNNV